MPRKAKASWQARGEFSDRRYRRVDTRLWHDARVRSFSLHARMVWVFLLTAPSTTAIPGLFRLREEEGAALSGLPVDGFREGFAELVRDGLVEADWAAGVVWVRNAPKYEWPSGPNVLKGWRRVLRTEIPESPLVARAMASISQQLQGVYEDPVPFLESFSEVFPEGFAEPIPEGIPAQDAVSRMQLAGCSPQGSGMGSGETTPPSAPIDPLSSKQPGQAPLLMVAPSPPAAMKKRGKRKEGGDTDPRHRPLIAALNECHKAVCQGAAYGFAGGADAKRVTELLTLADADEATRGERASAEVLRRWRIGLRWRWRDGTAPVTNLRGLVANWNACRGEDTAPPPGHGTGGPSRGISDWDAYVAERGSEARVYTGQEITQEAFGNRGNDT